MRPVAETLYRSWGKRFLDLAIGVPTLIVLSPILLLVFLAVRIKLGSPALFRQQRPGLHGHAFTIHKFRTMTDARDDQGDLLTDTERLTKLGAFLRGTSIDELPELFDVLRGDMSLVGPRPLLTIYLERYTPEQMRRHKAKPGITGWAQINGRNAITWEQKFAFDTWYVDHLSLGVDLQILLLTAWKVLRREGINPPEQPTTPEFMGTSDRQMS